MEMKEFFLQNKNKIAALTAAVLVLGGVFVAETATKKQQSSEPSQSAPPSVTAKATVHPSEEPTISVSPTPGTPVPSAVPTVSAEPASEISSEPVIEEKTEALPSEQTFSVEKAEEKKNLCTLTVRCDEILKNMDKLNPEKKELIPDNGIIFSGEVEINDGESVFDVLLREMKARKIHMEFVNTPATNSAYIKGINNIYEFDCGGFSGWTYTVNGEMQNVGCSQCYPKPGDTIEWKYTCTLPAIG